jgi:hypothetical protein
MKPCDHNIDTHRMKEHIPPVPKELTGTTTFYHEVPDVRDKPATISLYLNVFMMSFNLTVITPFDAQIKVVSEKRSSTALQAFKDISSAKLI